MASRQSKEASPNEGGRLLALELERREMTQAKAEALLPAARGIVSRLISGERRPGRALALKLHKTFGIDQGAWDRAPKAMRARTGTDG